MEDNSRFKFRGYDEDEDVMVAMEEYGSVSKFFEQADRFGWKVMQWTGLQDKNGNEVYEGDILSAPMSNRGHSRANARVKVFPAVVKWSAADANFTFWPVGDIWTGDYRFFPTWKECEIVGNIHQHQQLLKEAP